MKHFIRYISLTCMLIGASSQAHAIGLVWGEGNWGDTEWSSEVTEPVAPPDGPIPAATKIRGVSETDAGFSTGAYAATGSPTYSNSFTAGDFITIIGQVLPDSSDVGKSGQLVVVLLSVIEGEVIWSFLNTDGNFESWDLSFPNLGSAQEIDELDASHSITIFEGNLAAGAHRLALGYMAQGGPLIYTPKAINFVVSE